MMSEAMKTVWKRFQGLSFLLLLPLSALFASMTILAPNLIFFLFSHSIYRRVISTVSKSWFTLACFLLERVGGTQVLFYSIGEKDIPMDETCLILSNHRTRIDWMYYWCLCQRRNSLGELKIFLKSPLKKIPGIGWAMQHMQFIFLNRSWDLDRHYLTRFLKYLQFHGGQMTLLLFPEGTDLSEKNIVKSNEFARKSDLPEYRHVLHPRTTGFCHVLPLLRNSVSAVYDCTMVYEDYSDGERPSEMSLLYGRFPKKVSIYMERFEMDKLPKDPNLLAKWLNERYAQKEKVLTVVNENGTPPKGAKQIMTDDFSHIQLYHSIFWMVFVLGCCYLWYWSYSFRVYIVSVSLGYLVVTKCFGGFDTLEMEFLGEK